MAGRLGLVLAWVSGPGVTCPKNRRSGCEPVTLDEESFLSVLSGLWVPET